MKAMRLQAIGHPLQLTEMPTPQPQEAEVLVKVRAAGICSSDLHYRDGGSQVTQLPLTLGHEIAGEIVDVGKGVEELQPGDRVTVFYLSTCGKCIHCTSGRDRYCEQAKMLGKDTDGGFAQYLSVPARNCFKLPENIPYTQGALIADAVATPFHALSLARVRPGENVMILGIGGLGIHAIQIARLMGAAQIIAVDIIGEKLDLARELGATVGINPLEEDPVDKTSHLTNHQGVEVAVEFIGIPSTIRTGIMATGKGGRAILVGICPQEIPLHPYHDLILMERTIMGSADQERSDFPAIIELVQQGRINLSRSVTREFSLEEVNQGIRLLETKEERSLVRSVISMDG